MQKLRPCNPEFFRFPKDLLCPRWSEQTQARLHAIPLAHCFSLPGSLREASVRIAALTVHGQDETHWVCLLGARPLFAVRPGPLASHACSGWHVTICTGGFELPHYYAHALWPWLVVRQFLPFLRAEKHPLSFLIYFYFSR